MTAQKDMALTRAEPTMCHSPATCRAVSRAPERDGWFYLELEAKTTHNGWWCPRCTGMLKDALRGEPGRIVEVRGDQ
jgi:hypothetical protein